MSDVDRLRRAARATVRRGARSPEAEAERLRRNAERSAERSGASQDAAASTPPASTARTLGATADAPAPRAQVVAPPAATAVKLAALSEAGLQLYGEEGPLDAEDQLLAVQDAILETTVAPDPYDGEPEARAAALAPLVHGSTRAFGLSRLPPSFHALGGAAKLEWLLALPAPIATIQALPSEEFVLLLDEIGLADGADLLELASPRQMQSAVDILAWQGDTLDRRTFAHILAVAVSAGPDVVDRFLAAQEDGVLTAFAFGSALVFEGFEDAEQGAPDDWELFAAPDGHLQIAVDPDDAALGPIRAIIESLYRGSIERGRRVLRALRWELPLSLQEDLYDHRARRLAELGMVPRDEALAIFAYEDPEVARRAIDARLAGDIAPRAGDVRAFVAPPELIERTDLALHASADPAFLAAAAALLSEAEAARVQTALCFCVYRLQCALADHPADTEALRAHARQALTTVDLGLRFAARDDIGRGAQLLVHEPVEALFSLGHGLVVRLHHRAIALRRRLGAAGRASLFDGIDGAIVRGLLRPQPLWPASADELAAAAVGSRDAARWAIAALAAGAVDDDAEADGQATWHGAGADGLADEGAETDDATASSASYGGVDEERVARERAARAGMRPYETRADLDRAVLALQRWEAVIALIERAAAGPLPAALDALDRALGERQQDWDLSALLATTLAQGLVTGTPTLAPLDADALRGLLARAMEGPPGQRRLRHDLRTALARAALSAPDLDEAQAQGLEAAIAAAFDRIDAELGGLDPRQPIDVRFIGRALVVKGRPLDPSWN